MESPECSLIKVTQHEVKEMLVKRVLNPKKYIDKPLLIWRGYFEDGIQRELFFNFDSSVRDRMLTHEDKVAPAKWVFIKLDNINDRGLSISDKKLDRVLCLILKYSDQFPPSTHFYEEYSSIINKSWLKKVQEEINAPIVVYLPFLPHSEAFKGFDQYVFSPDFDEWKEKLSEHKKPLIRHLSGFLESSKNEEERNYRWYWYFQRQKETAGLADLKVHFEGSGCDFPSCWMEGIHNLRRHFIFPMAQMPKNYILPKPTKISEIPVDEFRDFFKVGISEDVIEDFREYLIKHDVEIQGNIRIL